MSFYPSKGAIYTGKKGLNFREPHVLQLDPDEMRRSKNMVFFRAGKSRRRAFTRYSTENWAADNFQKGTVFVDKYGNSRPLVNFGSGVVKEIRDATTSFSIISGAGTDRKGVFAPTFGACFFANADIELQRIDGAVSPATYATSRKAGVPAPLAGFGAAAGAAGARAGNYAFIGTSVIEVGGVKVLESDWSDQIELTVASTKIDFTWTNPAIADPRVTHVYLYGTRDGGVTYFFIRKVALAAVGYTGDDTLDADLGVESPDLGVNIAPPDSPELVCYSGGRVCVSIGNTVYFSRAGSNAYDVESFPYSVEMPGDGPVKAMIEIGNPGGVFGLNTLMVFQDRHIHLVYQTDPKNPINTLSSDTGCVNQYSVVARGSGVFFVDRRKGVIYWPGEGKDLNQASERINNIFFGGGYTLLTANQSDNDISLVAWRDMLGVTVRDSSAVSYPNKTYWLNLLKFETVFPFKGADSASEWLGPWEGPGWDCFIPMPDRGLLLLDNSNKYISNYDESTFSDYLAGASSLIKYSIQPGPILKENLRNEKTLRRLYLFAYNSAIINATVKGESDRWTLPAAELRPDNYGIPVDDIPLDDISTVSETWRSRANLENGYWAKWFLIDFNNDLLTSDDNSFVYIGYEVEYVARPIRETFI